MLASQNYLCYQKLGTHYITKMLWATTRITTDNYITYSTML